VSLLAEPLSPFGDSAQHKQHLLFCQIYRLGHVSQACVCSFLCVHCEQEKKGKDDKTWEMNLRTWKKTSCHIISEIEKQTFLHYLYTAVAAHLITAKKVIKWAHWWQRQIPRLLCSAGQQDTGVDPGESRPRHAKLFSLTASLSSHLSSSFFS
jgi:hypothetical protein